MKTTAVVEHIKNSNQDFEWYPTMPRMVDAIVRDLQYRHDKIKSFLDIGAGDGRVLAMLSALNENAQLFSIEKSSVLLSYQPDNIIPVGTEFYEQDLMSLPVDVIFCNPPYSEYDSWAHRIITTAHAEYAYLVLPQRWEDSDLIKAALKSRNATTKIIHTDDFLDAERAARAVVHVIRVTFRPDTSYGYKKEDPFDLWFEQNIDTFDREPAEKLTDYEREQRELARLSDLDSISGMVESFFNDYTLMQNNYKAIFKLDGQLLGELGVDKNSVREGLKKRMTGLKNTYWQMLFQRLDVITARLTTKTKSKFLERLTGQKSIAFTEANAYAVVLWAIKCANKYFDGQVVDVFRTISTPESIKNYTSNQRTWQKQGWRYMAEEFSHYALDYRVVLDHYRAIHDGTTSDWDYPGKLHTSCHEIIDDLIAVFHNLGFVATSKRINTRSMHWMSGKWHNINQTDGTILFQVKAFKNGNLHFRFAPDAIKALNIEAGRLLGWLQNTEDAVKQLGCTTEEAQRFFNSNQRLGASSIKLLNA